MNSSRSCRIPIDYAEDIDSKTVWPDKDLHKQYCRYWTLRYDGNIEKTYDMEAPQFRNQAEIEKYKSYVKRTKDNHLNKLTITRIGKKNDNIIYVDCNFLLKDKSGKKFDSSIRDQWIRIDGNWFHALKDPLFFPIKYE